MSDPRALRVAIVGSGPAGIYAADHLLENPGGTLVNGKLEKLVDRPVEVDVLERLPTPWGLIRGGVAPDHPDKKRMALRFEAVARRPGFRFFGNVDVGRQLAPAQLQSWYDAVIYAVGAESERRLGIRGEDLPGCVAARAFVGWYNGHPDFSHLHFDLDCQRAVIIGNGNVAMDVARILLKPVEELNATDIADHALAALSASRIKEVVIVGRRGPAEAACNYPELAEFGDLPDTEICVEGAAVPTNLPQTNHETELKLATLDSLCAEHSSGSRRLVFRFHTAPTAVLGNGRVEAIELAPATGAQGDRQPGVLQTGLVLAAIGYRCKPPAGLPFDETLGIIPSREARVLDGAQPISGAYVTGWIRRGPRGIIGSNKKCARDCVRALLADADAGSLPRAGTLDAAAALSALNNNAPQMTSYNGWRAIDRSERGEGARAGRPRVKLSDMETLLRMAETG